MNAFMIEAKYTVEERARLFREAHARCIRYSPVRRTRVILRQIERYAAEGIPHVGIATNVLEEGRELLASEACACWRDDERRFAREILDILEGLIDLALSPRELKNRERTVDRARCSGGDVLRRPGPQFLYGRKRFMADLTPAQVQTLETDIANIQSTVAADTTAQATVAAAQTAVTNDTAALASATTAQTATAAAATAAANQLLADVTAMVNPPPAAG